MQRSKKIILTSHCIFNQNTVIHKEARANGPLIPAVNWIMEQGYGIIQLPCPELSFLGLDRPSMTYEEYDNEQYRRHIKEILHPFMKQIIEYVENDYEIIGVFAIQGSPSCDPIKGVFIEEIEAQLLLNGIKIEHYWYIPNSEIINFDKKINLIYK